MTVLRSVMIGSIALVGLVLSCTAPNPAYNVPGGSDAAEAEVDTAPAARMHDAGAPDFGSPSSAGPACKGSARPPLDMLVAVDSLAIDATGNIYFSNDDGTKAWIGRLTPAGAVDKHWLTITAGLPTRGMAIDDTRKLIYFTAGTAAPELQAAPLDGAPPMPATVYKGFLDPNDVAMGFDGNVYVSDQGDGQIYSVSPATRKRTRVTTMPIGIAAMGSGPAGLAFGPDHTLVVGYKGGGQLVRIALTAGTPEQPSVEARRATFGPISDWVNALVYDQRGRLYLALFDLNALRDVVRLERDDAPPFPIASGGHFSSMAFGRGALDCHDLYIADPGAGMTVRRFPTDSTGLLP
jgi:streptogramin lyase